VVASVYGLLATPAQALPLARLGTANTVEATPTSVIVAGSPTILPRAFDSDPAAAETFLFSFGTPDSGGSVVVSMRDESLVDVSGMRLDGGADHAFSADVPATPPTAVLIISSAIVSVGTTRRRRRGPRPLKTITTPSGGRKEVSSRALEAPSRIAEGSSYSIPLRI
jgi:hypothetical protein